MSDEPQQDYKYLVFAKKHLEVNTWEQSDYHCKSQYHHCWVKCSVADVANENIHH